MRSFSLLCSERMFLRELYSLRMDRCKSVARFADRFKLITERAELNINSVQVRDKFIQ